MKINKLKVRMYELGLSQGAVAQEMGISQPTLSLKLAGKRPLLLGEAEKLSVILGIPNERFGEYFFNL